MWEIRISGSMRGERAALSGRPLSYSTEAPVGSVLQPSLVAAKDRDV